MHLSSIASFQRGFQYQQQIHMPWGTKTQKQQHSGTCFITHMCVLTGSLMIPGGADIRELQTTMHRRMCRGWELHRKRIPSHPNTCLDPRGHHWSKGWFRYVITCRPCTQILRPKFFLCWGCCFGQSCLCLRCSCSHCEGQSQWLPLRSSDD